MYKWVLRIQAGIIACFIIFCTLFFKNFEKIEYKMVETLGKNMTAEKKIVENEHDLGYKINVYLPYTAYSVLNSAIENLASTYIGDFKNEIKEYGILTHQVYSLIINYDMYNYKNYVSYVFTIFMDTAGAHPSTLIRTVNFDKERNEVITIDTLVNENKNILDKISKISLEELKKSPKFKENGYEDILGMLEDGTKAIENNFKSFAFGEDGLILFFEPYQVAPYFYGSFQIVIPYEKLGL